MRVVLKGVVMYLPPLPIAHASSSCVFIPPQRVEMSQAAPFHEPSKEPSDDSG